MVITEQLGSVFFVLGQQHITRRARSSVATARFLRIHSSSAAPGPTTSCASRAARSNTARARPRCSRASSTLPMLLRRRARANWEVPLFAATASTTSTPASAPSPPTVVPCVQARRAHASTASECSPASSCEHDFGQRRDRTAPPIMSIVIGAWPSTSSVSASAGGRRVARLRRRLLGELRACLLGPRRSGRGPPRVGRVARRPAPRSRLAAVPRPRAARQRRRTPSVWAAPGRPRDRWQRLASAVRTISATAFSAARPCSRHAMRRSAARPIGRRGGAPGRRLCIPLSSAGRGRRTALQARPQRPAVVLSPPRHAARARAPRTPDGGQARLARARWSAGASVVRPAANATAPATASTPPPPASA